MAAATYAADIKTVSKTSRNFETYQAVFLKMRLFMPRGSVQLEGIQRKRIQIQPDRTMPLRCLLGIVCALVAVERTP